MPRETTPREDYTLWAGAEEELEQRRFTHTRLSIQQRLHIV